MMFDTSSAYADRYPSPTVLVADDDDASRGRLAAALRDRGFGVLEARTSVEALLLAVEYPGRIESLFASTALRKYCNGVELAGCIRPTRPEMLVYYVDDARAPMEAAVVEAVRGEARLLDRTLPRIRLLEAMRQVEENHAWVADQNFTG